jgi:hypothetical protein
VEGYGRMEWREKNLNNVASYEGYFENDMEQGYGKGIWKNGDTYCGDWLKGKRTGNGTYLRFNVDSWANLRVWKLQLF